MLWVLTAIYSFNLLDRWALGMGLQSIKASLHLDDAELGLLSGLAFALFYSTVGVPIGWWADRANRVRIISITAVIWSVLVALTGRAANFAQLLLIRMGVGVGEAGCLPPAYSLIADYFPREESPRAFGIYFLAWPLSMLVGLFVAGWLNQLFGWRLMFTVVGTLGFLFAPLAWLTLKEPRLGKSKRDATAMSPVGQVQNEVCGGVPMAFWDTLRELFSIRTYKYLLYSLALNYFLNAIFLWLPTFFVRTYGLKTGMLGAWLAVIYGGIGTVSSALGGVIAVRWAKENERLQLAVSAVLSGCYGILYIFVFAAQNYHVAFMLLGIIAAIGYLITGPLFAAMQVTVPVRSRALSISIAFLFANLIGMGLGPLAIGWLSDLLHPEFGVASLRYALLIMSPGYLLPAWYVWKASKVVSTDIEARRDDIAYHSSSPGVTVVIGHEL